MLHFFDWMLNFSRPHHLRNSSNISNIIFEHDFVHGKCFLLIFCSWNLLCVDFCSWNLLHVDFSFRYICTSIFLLVKLILFMELVVWWFLFVELFACCFFLFMKLVNWFFSSCNWFCSWSLLRANFCSWNLLQIDFFLRETDLVHGICCVLNFSRETCCMLIFLSVKIVHWFFCSWNRFC